MKSQYGYDELIAAANMDLPNEFEILDALEMLASGTGRPGFDPVPTLNDLVKSREAQRILKQDVPEFKNAALRRYEKHEINESQLWDIVEKVVSSI